MEDFRGLEVWQRAHQTALTVYRVTAPFPSSERFGLTSQLRRAAVSVPANIAESCDRGTIADQVRFFQIAMGSASELEHHLLLARDLELLPREAHAAVNEQVVEIKRMLAAFIVKMRPNGRQSSRTVRETLEGWDSARDPAAVFRLTS